MEFPLNSNPYDQSKAVFLVDLYFRSGPANLPDSVPEHSRLHFLLLTTPGKRGLIWFQRITMVGRGARHNFVMVRIYCHDIIRRIQ